MRSPLRVLVTTDTIGGVWQYSIELAQALVACGVEPTIVTLGPPPDAAQRARAGDIPLIVTTLALDWLCIDAALVQVAAAALAERADRMDAACVHLHTPTLAGAATFTVPVVAVAHGCVATWWEATCGTPLATSFLWHRALMQQGLRSADKVVTPTRAYGALVARHYGLKTLPHVIHNGRTPPGPGLARPMHDRAFTIGRLWDRAKNTALLDRAARRLSVPFMAAGPVAAPHGETIRLDAMHCLGTLDDLAVADHLSHRPVFVSAAVFEPFGLAVLEAAAAGCALVLSDIATFRELWDGVADFVPPNDEAGFVHAIEDLISDRPRRVRMGDAARQRACAYTPAAAAAAMARIYKTLVTQAAIEKAGA